MEAILDLESDADGCPIRYPPAGEAPADGVYLFAELDADGETLTIIGDPYRLQAGEPWPSTAHLDAPEAVWLRVVGVAEEPPESE